MNVSATITVTRPHCYRERCPCAFTDGADREIEVLVSGTVEDIGADGLDPIILKAAALEGPEEVYLTGREEQHAGEALCSEYERLEKLERAARRTLRLIPYVMPEATEC